MSHFPTMEGEDLGSKVNGPETGGGTHENKSDWKYGDFQIHLFVRILTQTSEEPKSLSIHASFVLNPMLHEAGP